MHYTEEQIERANAADLAAFLRNQGEELIKSGSEFRWKRHDSLTLKDNRWYRHSRNIGGYPIGFVMEFFGKTFPEAVRMLTGEEAAEGSAIEEKAAVRTEAPELMPSPDFHLPERNTDDHFVIRYLTHERGLDRDLVKEFILRGDIYEEARHHNAVFVGRDENGIPRYASLRGTGERFRQEVTGSDKSFGFGFSGDGPQLFIFEAPIDLLSFIQLFPKNWRNRSLSSLGGVSGKALERILSERKDITEVFLCLDNDAAGNEASKKLAASVPEGIRVTRLLPVRKDWNDVLWDRDHIENRKYIEATVILKEAQKAPPVSMIRMSEVAEEEVKWLWYPYIPFGKLTILQGNPGEGKTYFAMELAAACTNRRPLPGMEVMEPFNIIYQTAEDGLGDTVKPRLLEAGADLDRVLVINDAELPLTLSDDRIERAIIENQAKLLVIDPIQAFMGANVDMNRANEVRPVLRKLGYAAQKTGCAILLIGHLNKTAGVQSTYRGLGSIDFTAAVRSLLFIGKLKGSDTTRILAHEKSSLAPPGVSLAFSLGDEEGFRWIGPYDLSADELLSGCEENRESKLEQAEELIYEMLSEGKHVPVSAIEAEGKKRNISARTLRTARSRIASRIGEEYDSARNKLVFLK